MRGATFFAAAAAMLATGSVAAQVDETPPRRIENMGRPVYVAPLLSFTVDDSARRTKVGYGGTLALGTRLLSFAAVEALAYYTKFNDEDDIFVGARTEATGYGGNLLLFPLPGAMRDVFLLAGAAYNDVRNHPLTVDGVVGLADYDSTVYDLGLGYLGAFDLFGNPAALRVEAKYRLDDHGEPDLGDGSDDRFGDVVLSAGFMFPLFYRPPPPPPAPEPIAVVAVADADNDGVLDDVDQCPDTAYGASVDATGCTPAPAPEPVCAPVGDNGEVDLSGCAAGDVVVLRGVTFEFDSARLTADAQTILDGVVAALQAAPEIRVEIGGHTDARGSEAYNQRLSERRAASVRDYLVDHGIDGARLTAVGYGETRPVADNDSEEGREQNRRVELTVM
ncbi:OmpA family protein [Sinimarinibacterium thermocellulolyticum]|uniref:OmpA family protein n=1 Tax=Sinimarinibacterium thermocellulolyticum TaxID=3170016 RepID=A0ABV2ACQ8_9GAMM